jgi:hypothetical protein
MAARDRYTFPITCPECKQHGVLHLSEDDYPFMRDPHIEVDKVEGDFQAEGRSEGRVKITCKKCNNTFTK